MNAFYIDVHSTVNSKLFSRPLLIFFFLFLLQVSALGQETITVTGTVTGEQNRPLEGVSVLVKGTTTGLTTDASGRYSISAPANGSTAPAGPST